MNVLSRKLFFTFILIFSPTFVLHSKAEGKRFISLCNVITFNAEGFDEEKIKASADDDACRRWKTSKSPLLIVDLQILSTDGKEQPSQLLNTHLYIGKDQTDPPGPIYDFVKYRRSRGKYYFDRNRFLYAVNEWPVYQRKMSKLLEQSGIESIEPTANIRHWKNRDGDIVSCEIIYKSSVAQDEYLEKSFSFFRKNKLSASYKSPLIKVNDKMANDNLNAIENLFRSIKLKKLKT